MAYIMWNENYDFQNIMRKMLVAYMSAVVLFFNEWKILHFVVGNKIKKIILFEKCGKLVEWKMVEWEKIFVSIVKELLTG